MSDITPLEERMQIICNKNQYNEASLIEKIKLTIFCAFNKKTRTYVKHNSKLTKLIQEEPLECIPQKEKEELSKLFEQELKKELDKN